MTQLENKKLHLVFLLTFIASQQVRASHEELNRSHPWARHFQAEEILELENGDFMPTSVEQCPSAFIETIVPPSKYTFESYAVTTEDGYILTVFRLKSKSARQNNKVVFLQHGLSNDAGAWLQNGSDKGLAFLLANAGFDVWLGNNRGSSYSRKHASLSPNDHAFWDFSFDEMAEYDLPANLKYVNEVTRSKIIYIGHSQGTTQMFAALSDTNIRPKVAPLVRIFYALAPIVYLNQNRVPVSNYITYLTNLVRRLAWAFGVDYLYLGTCVWDQSTVNYWNNYCGDSPKRCYKKAYLTDLDPSVDNWER